MERLAQGFFDGGYFQTFVDKAYPPDGAGKHPYPFFPIRRDRVLGLCGEPGPKHFVDIGCGGGHLSERFLLSGATGICVDFSPRMLAWCGSRMDSLGVPRQSYRLLEGFASDLKAIETDSADLVLCIGPLEYCSDAEADAILAECVRIARPGGSIVTAHLNMLFDLFTLDKFTVEFYRRSIAPAFAMDDSKVDWVIGKMRDRLSLSETGTKTESIREDVKTRTDNPLTVREKFRDVGLTVQDMRFVRFFAAPPFCGNEDRSIAEQPVSLEEELSANWLGYIAASSFIVKSIKAD